MDIKQVFPANDWVALYGKKDADGKRSVKDLPLKEPIIAWALVRLDADDVIEDFCKMKAGGTYLVGLIQDFDTSGGIAPAPIFEDFIGYEQIKE